MVVAKKIDMAFKFEKLVVWQKSLLLTKRINELSKILPDDERYVLGKQIRRATYSISLNIAEGSTGQSNKEFRRFLTIANRSAIEVVACLNICKINSLIQKEDFDSLIEDLTKIIKMIQGLKNSLIL